VWSWVPAKRRDFITLAVGTPTTDPLFWEAGLDLDEG
jgi:hypothetical protein